MNKVRSYSRRALLAMVAWAASCASPRIAIPPPIPEGYYHLDSQAFYDGGVVMVAGDGRGGLRVRLLDHFGGSFRLAPGDDGAFVMRDADIDIEDDVRRSLRGTGRIQANGGMAGECVVWTGTLPGISRDHRSKPWVLRPMAKEEAERAIAKLRKRYPGRLEALGL